MARWTIHSALIAVVFVAGCTGRIERQAARLSDIKTGGPVARTETPASEPRTEPPLRPVPDEPPAPKLEPPPQPELPPAERLINPIARVQIGESDRQIVVTNARPMSITQSDGVRKFSPQTWVFNLEAVAPAPLRWRVYAKSYPANELAAARQAVVEWNTRGYDAELVPMGKRFQTASGDVLDAQDYWLAVGRFESEAKAKAVQEHLQAQRVWAWVRAERVAQGRGRVTMSRRNEGPIATLEAPLTISCPAPLRVSDARGGFWGAAASGRLYAGDLELRVDDAGELELIERVSIDDYLTGVVPAEMPALWPLEALKAQAVVARTESIAALETKHRMEGFDFCDDQHCRVYRGLERSHENVRRAIDGTHGLIVAKGSRIVPTVFSSNCGGWTANNDTIWSGPPNASLRAVADLYKTADTTPPSIGRWLGTYPPAYCAGDDRFFRWSRAFSQAELSGLVNKRHDVGTVQRIELGERGPSGRLKWLRVHGTRGARTIQKDAEIRQAFGGLPSSMFIIEARDGGTGSAGFIFRGGGRGHGVGMCQYGARGMALQGMNFRRIIEHYYSGVRLESYL